MILGVDAIWTWRGPGQPGRQLPRLGGDGALGRRVRQQRLAGGHGDPGSVAPGTRTSLPVRALPPHPLTRFAPAPTGHLHLGHVVNAIFVWGTARARGGKVLLRIEDHDRQRCRPEFESTLLEDLEWLGLEPDLGVPGEYRAGPCEFRQSDRDGIYSAELRTARLALSGLCLRLFPQGHQRPGGRRLRRGNPLSRHLPGPRAGV